MCGICGLIRFDGAPVAQSALVSMAAAIAHRGPDDSGVWTSGPVGLGSARLAVIDLSPAGRQPLATENGDVRIVFNGEIYNFLSLREEAVKRGHRFRSRTDTETIAHLFEERGIECVHLLRGMFALAIWDGRSRELWLARDRLGKKPLYYFRDENRLVFGSEIKSILACPDVPRRLDRRALPLYLTYGYIPAPQTIFTGIRCLPPASWLRVKDGQIDERNYWTPPMPAEAAPDSVRPSRSERDWAAALLDQLREAVRLRLISDVPLGAFLSGGLDSSAVVALMVEAQGGAGSERVKTFAIGFGGEPSYDETAPARTVANYLGTDHREFVVEPQAVDLIPKLVWHLDQPFGDSSAVPTYLVSKLAREHVTVALTGDGGDELFAGYERFHAARLARHYRRLPEFVHRGVMAAARRWPQGTGYRDWGRRLLRFANAAGRPLPERYLSWVGIMPADQANDLLQEQGADESAAAHFANYFRADDGGDPLPVLLDVNLRSYLPDDLLIKTDRMSMAASLEARSPFLDHVLVEFACGMPASLKLKGGVGKYILRRAFEGRLPPEIIRRRKHGFGVPVGRWFRASLREYLTEMLLSRRAAERGLVRPEAAAQWVSEHLSGQRDHGQALWALLMLEVWCRSFLDAPPDRAHATEAGRRDVEEIVGAGDKL